MDRAGIVMGFLLVKKSLLVRETSVLPEVGHENRGEFAGQASARPESGLSGLGESRHSGIAGL